MSITKKPTQLVPGDWYKEPESENNWRLVKYTNALPEDNVTMVSSTNEECFTYSTFMDNDVTLEVV